MSWRGEWLRRNGGSSCPVVIPQPVCARVSCTGTENGKGKVQMGPGKHRLCVAGLSLTVNLSGIFCAAPNAGERGITSQDEGLSLDVTADG